jgi:UDP-hydrolysing UDP-N-acetyl-D-glucosamine 2-epimerase
MHRAEDAPAIDLSGISATLHSAGRDLGGRADAAAASAMGVITAECGALLADIAPDLVLVIGDRLDMLPAAVATLPFNTPLVHLHGGEVTEGAIDDRARNAMTKLAHLHLVSCASAAERVRAMNEPEERIVLTGAPGLDSLRQAPEMSRVEFIQAAGLAHVPGSDDAFILATVHPETNSNAPLAPFDAVVGALDRLAKPVLFTAPNSDPGGAELARRLADWAATRPFVVSRNTLGPTLYPNALRHAAAMVGNSSSGIIEAGLFGVPVIDVGDRQKGRERAANVVAAPNNAEAVAVVLQRALAGGRFPPGSPYGNGDAAPQVAEAIFKANPSHGSIARPGATRGK